MDQPKDKFSELSPVLELIYVLMTNMTKYMNVYATDIEAEKTTQYLEAKDALDNAIRKFDALYGLKSPSSLSEEIPAVETPVVEQKATPPVDGPEPYDFASGSDPESLKKAKEAVEELKTLFADMKKEETATVPSAPVEMQTPQPEVVQNTTVTAPVEAPPMPTFVAPAQDAVQQSPAEAQPAKTDLPSPMNPAPVQQQQDAGEIDAILKELKDLQSKGSAQQL